MIMKRNINYIIIVFFALAFSSCKSDKTVFPKKKEIIEAVYASGFVMAKNEYKLYAFSDGYITEKYSSTGDIVRKNEAVYKVQSDAPAAKYDASTLAYDIARKNTDLNSPALRELQIKIQNAETVLANDELNFSRIKNMYEANAVSKSEYDKAFANYQVSKNNFQIAKESLQRAKDQFNVELQNSKSQLATSGSDLSNFVLRSAINGIVYETYKELGEVVRKNDVVALIGEKEGKYLQLAVDQQDIGRIRIGQEVLARLDITGENTFKAVISKIYPKMNQNDQSFMVEATFLDGKANIDFIHSSVEANIIIRKKADAIVLPKVAFDNEGKVAVKGLGKNNLIKVERGIENLEEVEILSGVSEKDEIVLPKQ
jgi:multidrug efflux pump subunit AcrA (membrane-fusion protein)